MKHVGRLWIALVALVLVLGLALPPGGAGAERTNCAAVGEARVVTAVSGGEGWMGAWVDEVIITAEPDPAQAVLKLTTGDIDIYAWGLTDPELVEAIRQNPDVEYFVSYGAMRDLRFNTVGPIFPGTGKLNPFAVPRMREAVNWLIDREYIVDQYLGGMGYPKWTALGTQFLDHTVRYPHIVAAIEAYYQYDFEWARGIFNEEMPRLGAQLVGGKWHYGGAPVEIVLLIRSDLPPYPGAGYYIADQLEAVGFQVTRLVKTGYEASPIWFESDPADGLFHIYTGGWAYRFFPRDQANAFDQMYTHRVMWSPLWEVLEEQLADWRELDEASRMLSNREFATWGERRALFETVLWEAMKFSNCVWVADVASANPYRHDVFVVGDAAVGILGRMWAYTTLFRDGGRPVPGGTLRMDLPQLLLYPWNPVAGSESVYDLLVYRNSLGDSGTLPDPRNGLHWPHRIESAAVTIKQGLPVGRTLDWLTLDFAHQIAVPSDAWADWDPISQRFITVAERFPGGATALRKSVVTYPAEIFDTPLHDGSTLSMADFILAMIMRFDRGKEASPVYDPAEKGTLDGLLHTFKGVRIVSVEPNLVIETYSDLWYLDAEANVTTWFPAYGRYDVTGFWHMIAVGWLAEEHAELAFSGSRAGALGVEWMDYTRGPSLPVLKKWLDWAAAQNFVPYAPTMGNYVTPAEAAERWANLQDWYADKGHFWVGDGPLYLESANTVTRLVHLKRFEDYPDPADRWYIQLQIPLPAAPGRQLPALILPGDEFEVAVTFTAPAHGFHAVELTDIAPAGWTVSVDAARTMPSPTEARVSAPGRVVYTWDGPYTAGQPFTVVYRVQVPPSAKPGTYAFDGSLQYYLEPHPASPYAEKVTLDIRATVVEEHILTVSSIAGGSVIQPGEGQFTYYTGNEVSLATEADEGYRFVNWAGDVDTVSNIFSAQTTITVEGDYQIMARFAAVLDSRTETVADDTVDARAEADTEVVVQGTATVTAAKYAENPGGEAPAGFVPLASYVDVCIHDTENVTEIEIRLYYTDDGAEAADIEEDSLRLFWWNGTAWERCSRSGVSVSDVTGYSGYIWAIIKGDTTPSLDDLEGTPFGGFGSSPGVPKPGFCAIATAAYGTDTADELDVLRDFRDSALLPNSLGAWFVGLYYRTSPPVAGYISRYEALRTAVRVSLIGPMVVVLTLTQGLWSVAN